MQSRVQLTKRHEVTERSRVGQARYLRAGKGGRIGRGQICCRFTFESKKNKDKPTLQQQEGSELAWGKTKNRGGGHGTFYLSGDLKDVYLTNYCLDANTNDVTLRPETEIKKLRKDVQDLSHG